MAQVNNSVSAPSTAPISTLGSTGSAPKTTSNFVKASYMNLPPATRGLVTVVGVGIILYIAYKIYKNISDTAGGIVSQEKGNKQEDRGWGADADKLNQNPATRATITTAQASSFSNSLHAAMDGYGTDEDSIYAIFRHIKNDADFALLMNAYGVREVSSGAWNPEPNYTGTLTGALTSELAAEDKAKINNILSGKKITYKV